MKLLLILPGARGRSASRSPADDARNRCADDEGVGLHLLPDHLRRVSRIRPRIPAVAEVQPVLGQLQQLGFNLRMRLGGAVQHRPQQRAGAGVSRHAPVNGEKLQAHLPAPFYLSRMSLPVQVGLEAQAPTALSALRAGGSCRTRGMTSLPNAARSLE